MNNESSSEELRALLRTAEFSRGSTPVRAVEGSSDVPLDELAYLISSLDVDLGTPLRATVRNRHSISNAHIGAGAVGRPLQSSMTPAQGHTRDTEEVYNSLPLIQLIF